MTSIELAARQLERGLDWLKMSLADFSEEDMYRRPVPAANHAAWQLGHLVASEAMMVNWIRPGTLAVPPSIAGKFDPPQARVDDPAAFGVSKDELLAALESLRKQTVAFVRTLRPEDLDRPMPEKLQDYVPTVADTLTALLTHAIMHLGQFQVIRRALGKKVLF